MIKINKNIILIVFILGIILIAGCVVKISQPIAPTASSTPSAAKEAQPQTTIPLTETSKASTASSASASAKPATEITSVLCDGKSYNILVKPKHSIMWIMLEAVNKQEISDLKSEGLIEEFNEVIRNDGASVIPTKQTYKGDTGSGSGDISVLAGWVWFIIDVKNENADKVRERVQTPKQTKVGTGYSGYGYGTLWSNSGDKDTSFEFKCRIPTGPGRITVYSNIPDSSFTVTGTKSYTGNGLCWTTFDVPNGKYTFTFNDVAGYTAPTKVGLELRPEEHLKFGANYRTAAPADTGAIIVITNLQEAKFTIKGPATYSGSGICWGQSNVPTGQYEIVFDDVPGYELSYFGKKKSIYVSSGFGLQTAESEYKKIGS